MIELTDEMVDAYWRAATAQAAKVSRSTHPVLREGSMNRAGLTAVLAIVELGHTNRLAAVAHIHQEFEGRCIECVEFCDCPDRHICEHGNVPWPCPTAKAGGFL